MYCIQCGAKNPDDSNFCRKCGMDVRTLRSAAADNPPDASEVDDEEVSLLLERAYQYYDAGSLDLAFEAVRNALRANPESVAGRSLLASIYERRGNLEAAIRQMERVVDSNPESTADINRLEALKLQARIEREEMEPPAAGGVWQQKMSRPKVMAGAGIALLLVAAIMVFASRGGRVADRDTIDGAQAPAAQTTPAASQPQTGQTPGIVNSSLFPEGATTAEGHARQPSAESRRPEPALPQPPIPRPANTQPATPQPVQPAPAPQPAPQTAPQPSITIRPSQPEPSPAPAPAPPSSQMTGLDYQRAAMDYKARGDRENAIANFRRAIEAFRREAAVDGQAAQKGIRSCELELRLLGVE